MTSNTLGSANGSQFFAAVHFVAAKMGKVKPSGYVMKSSLAAVMIVLAGCSSSPPKAPSKGDVYVGPPTLNLRSEIATQSPVVTTVKHGDKLEIVDRQRQSFFKVRAPNGAEGWTDQRQLLGSADMAALKALSAHAASMASEGKATTDSDLRVRIQPSPNSPSFLMLKTNDQVDVLARIRRPRTDLPRQPLVTPPAKKAKATRRPSKTTKIPPPPLPLPPAPPSNWLELSKGERADDEPAERDNTGPPLPTDGWSLVRTPDGQSGWALTRRLRMAIPDEVGQYAEGHTIVSYYSLGSVPDGDQKKDTWLWTTISEGGRPYDFDSFRIFVWSSHRHRYETEHVERNLTGFLPVEFEQVHYAGKGKEAANGGQYAGFSVCVQMKDGQLSRRQYALTDTHVRFAGEEPCVLPPPLDFGNPGPAPTAVPASTASPVQETLVQRLKRRLKSWTGH
jgi:SH3-like domain-containing protein